MGARGEEIGGTDPCGPKQAATVDEVDGAVEIRMPGELVRSAYRVAQYSHARGELGGVDAPETSVYPLIAGTGVRIVRARSLRQRLSRSVSAVTQGRGDVA